MNLNSVAVKKVHPKKILHVCRPSLMLTFFTITTNPRRFGNVCGGIRSWWKKFNIFPCRCVLARKNIRFFLYQDTPARSYSKFFLAGPVSSRQYVQILTKMCKIIIIPRRGVPARKNLIFWPEEFSPRTNQTYPAKWCLGSPNAEA